MTKRYAIFMALFIWGTIGLVGCLPLWKVPEGLSRFENVSLWELLPELLCVMGRAERLGDVQFIARIYGQGILIAAGLWVVSFVFGHLCYWLLFHPTTSAADRPD